MRSAPGDGQPRGRRRVRVHRGTVASAPPLATCRLGRKTGRYDNPTCARRRALRPRSCPRPPDGALFLGSVNRYGVRHILVVAARSRHCITPVSGDPCCWNGSPTTCATTRSATPCPIMAGSPSPPTRSTATEPVRALPPSARQRTTRRRHHDLDQPRGRTWAVHGALGRPGPRRQRPRLRPARRRPHRPGPAPCSAGAIRTELGRLVRSIQGRAEPLRQALGGKGAWACNARSGSCASSLKA